MSPTELNEAIIGARYKEAREFKLTRLIALMIGKYIGAFNKSLKPSELYPLLFDKKISRGSKKDRLNSEKWQAMEAEFARRDRLKKNKK